MHRVKRKTYKYVKIRDLKLWRKIHDMICETSHLQRHYEVYILFDQLLLGMKPS